MECYYLTIIIMAGILFSRKCLIASEAAKGQLNTDVFISYSRKDSDFARRLNMKLQQAGKMTWFDQESISSGVDFETEIFKGIAGADNLVFILSPDAVTSEYCEREVQFADQEGKRFIPLLYREVNPAILPAALRKQQWISSLLSSASRLCLPLCYVYFPRQAELGQQALPSRAW